MIKAVVFAALFTTAVGVQALAQTAASGIRDVISSQMEAFKADDFSTAFTFASPAIKRMFGTPENFGRMVRQGYPMVWRPASVEFGELEARGDKRVQAVRVIDQQGNGFVLDYEMVETEKGWQINGVWIRERFGLGA